MQQIAECGQLKQCVGMIEWVVFALKLQYLAQLLVGRQQVALLVVECLAHDTLLKQLAIAVCQVHLLLLLQSLFCLVV